MATFLYKTKGNADPKGKPKVYFTCYPEDFDRYFDKVCEDIFATHDCAIYYTPDMTEEIADEDKATDIGQMNLFVVPITFRLLTKPNRAMDSDIAYAKQESIPILPLMMESGIDEFYSKPDKFDKLQYLSPYSHDLSEISYADKLKKYLESVLISDEMAKRVRAAFDAYIFLSYRKKDRRYANELMRMIHKHPEFRDIAIWYDEFLTPGESFRANIDKALENSKFFALLVTPNLLETVDGRPNFVMAEEYPMAKRAEMKILPAEMVETDKTELGEKYEGIPECANPSNEAEFKERFLDALERIAIAENNESPEHNFLIGLAYLDGIDVEFDRERGLELITSAAERGLLEAMEMLFWMYKDGTSVQVDYSEAFKWAERIYENHKEHDGEEHLSTLTSLSNLAFAYGELGDDRKALELNEKVYALECRICGEDSPITLKSMNNLAQCYGNLGDYRKALELNEKVYNLRCVKFGEEHSDTLVSLHNLAHCYGNLGDYRKALEFNEKVYNLRCKILGEDHIYTLMSLNNLAYCNGELGDRRKELELHEKAYTWRCKILGEDHPDTLDTLHNIAYTHGALGDYRKALEVNEKVYNLRYKILGENHPDTLQSLSNQGYYYASLGDYCTALELNEKVYGWRCKILGEEHPDTFPTLNNLANAYSALGNHQKALELYEKVYSLCCKSFGEEHPDTLITLSNLANAYNSIGDQRKALEVMEIVYTLRCKVIGEKHPDTIDSLKDLIWLCNVLRKTKRAMILTQKLKSLTRKKK